MLCEVDALHRIETLPGVGRYVVTFRGAGGGEQTAVVHVSDAGLEVADAALPADWRRDNAYWADFEAAVRAVDRACRVPTRGARLRDVDGGYDVGLGNVILGRAGIPVCTADGDMVEEFDVWVCPTCGAQAALT